MFRDGDHDESPIAVLPRPARPDPALPWSWPEGTRLLLAVVAIVAAVGLMIGRRERDRDRARLVGPTPAVGLSDWKLNPNRATAEALASLPGIGPTLAGRIVAAQADGPFRSPEDLRARVRGIGPVTLARIRPYLRLDDAPGIPAPLDSSPTMIADAADARGSPPATRSRKPPRSRKRKAGGSSVQLAAKAGAPASP